jgi:protein TIF31
MKVHKEESVVTKSLVNGQEKEKADPETMTVITNGLDGDESQKGESEAEKAAEERGKEEQEVVFIQDMGFTVKIVSPGTEPFDIQVGKVIIFMFRD